MTFLTRGFTIFAVLLRLSKWLVVLTLTFSLGTHWVLLQSVAWVGMIVNYSRDASLVEAVSKTFDGQHPCCLCKAIAAGKSSERKNPSTIQIQKLEFPPAGQNPDLIPPSHFQLLPRANSFASSLVQKPPVPPPRSSLV